MAGKSRHRYSDVGDSGEERLLSLADANAERLIDVVNGLLAVGDALVIGATRDGGAIRVQIYSGDDKPSWYVTNAAEFDALMLKLRGTLDD